MSSSNSSGGGVGTLGLLGVVFVTLKLTGIITWSWVWVTAPFWFGLAFAALLAAVGLTLIGVANVAQWLGKRSR